MTELDRGSFGSKIGLILATAGGAVGLGNVWRFPLIWQARRWCCLHLGLYSVCSFGHSLYDFRVYHRPSWSFEYSPCLYSAVERKGPEVGGLLGGAYRFPYYGLLCRCVGLVPTVCVCQHHGRAAWRPNLCSRVLQGVLCRSYTACHVDGSHLSDLSFVIIHGVRGGIEKASKIMMPVLFILLLIIVVAACLLPNAGKGVEFLLKPDFSKVDNGVFLVPWDSRSIRSASVWVVSVPMLPISADRPICSRQLCRYRSSTSWWRYLPD